MTFSIVNAYYIYIFDDLLTANRTAKKLNVDTLYTIYSKLTFLLIGQADPYLKFRENLSSLVKIPCIILQTSNSNTQNLPTESE